MVPGNQHHVIPKAVRVRENPSGKEYPAYQALCSCGWSGMAVETEEEATHQGESHTRAMAKPDR